MGAHPLASDLEGRFNGDQGPGLVGNRNGSSEQPFCPRRCTYLSLSSIQMDNTHVDLKYLSYKPLPTLLSFLTPSSGSTVSARSKALYALSGLLKHNAPAVKQLSEPEVDGWGKIRGALQDPNIGVRRKAIFLLGTLLTPTSPSTESRSNQSQQHQPPLMLAPAPPGSTTTPNIALHPTANAPETTQSLAIHTPDSRPAESPNEPIHDNSHAAHLRDASRAQTSPVTQEAMNKHGILDAVISSVVSPLPHGADGENTDADNDFDEKALRCVALSSMFKYFTDSHMTQVTAHIRCIL